MTSPLTNRQQRFVDEFLIDHNATQAAIRAGYSPKTAYTAGPRLSARPAIQKEINARLNPPTDPSQITQQRVVREMACIGFSQSSDVKTSEKLRALELLGKHLGLFTEKKPSDDIEDLTPLRQLLGGSVPD